MFLLAILAVVIVSFYLTAMIGGELYYYIDLVTILVLLVLVGLILVGSGMFKHFNNAFRIVLKKQCYATLQQLKLSKEAVVMVISIINYGVAFSVAFTMVAVLYQLDDPAGLGPALSVMLLFVVYGAAINLLLLTIKTRINTLIINCMEMEESDSNKMEESNSNEVE